MKNIIKTTAYSAVALSSIAYTKVLAAGLTITDLDRENWKDLSIADTQGGNIGATILGFIKYLLWFLGLIGVIIFLWAGFQILTAGWDDEKVKKGKTTMINAVIGIVVIVFAWAIVSWLLEGFVTAVQTKNP